MTGSTFGGGREPFSFRHSRSFGQLSTSIFSYLFKSRVAGSTSLARHGGGWMAYGASGRIRQLFSARQVVGSESSPDCSDLPNHAVAACSRSISDSLQAVGAHLAARAPYRKPRVPLEEIARQVGVGTTGVAMAVKGMEKEDKTE
jgi:hypothetical protein